MLFEISRASNSLRELSPIKGTKKFNATSKNKKVEKPIEIWIGEINNLEEIIDLVKNEGEIIISEEKYLEEVEFSITIYDDYVE